MSASKRKGTAWETRLVAYLRSNGFPYAERRTTEGRNDRGDVSGIPGVCIEAKNTKTLDLAGWIDETTKETATAGAQVGFATFPRRNHATGKAYVLMTLDQVIELIK